jgi:uncharacterized membrane protein/nitrite reductase/ring-hydroxylating ferredoxin subunit
LVASETPLSDEAAAGGVGFGQNAVSGPIIAIQPREKEPIMLSKARIQSHPIHPMLVAFPIGLWVTSFIFDLIGAGSHEQAYFMASFYMILAGCVGAVLAALPGAIDLFAAIPPHSSARSRGYLHGGLNLLALLLFIYTAWRRGGPAGTADGMAILVSAIGVVLIGISGWLGGTLVYRNQIGVDHRYANAGKFKERTIEDFSRPVCNQSELGDGQMMLAKIAGERIALGRYGDGLFAFADRCTHKGGPLSDGVLVGCTVQCPWHGSQFDVRTGRVVAGPAEKQIRIYQVEVRAGEVYLSIETAAEQRPKAA